MVYTEDMGLFGKKKLTPQEFWAWFLTIEKELYQLLDASQGDASRSKVIDELNRRISQIEGKVVYGIAYDKESNVATLELSPDGIRENIGPMRRLYDSRPTLPTWRFVEFKQRISGFGLEVAGHKVDDTNVLITSSLNAAGLYDVNVYVPIPPSAPKEAVGQIAFLMLDHSLGEQIVMTKIGRVEFTTADKAPAEAIPIGEFYDKIC